MMFSEKSFYIFNKKPCDDHQNEDELSQSSDKSIFFTMACQSLGKRPIKS